MAAQHHLVVLQDGESGFMTSASMKETKQGRYNLRDISAARTYTVIILNARLRRIL
jgi:hypothetical protein